MKRRLISYNVFENIQNNSLSNAEKELLAAGPILAKVLETSDLDLVCYGPEDVMYESADGFIHSNYQLGNSFVDFQNLEQLVVDEETEANHSKEILQGLVAAVIDGNEAKANEMFDKYIDQDKFKRDLNESVTHKAKKKKKSCCTTKMKSKKNAKAKLKFRTEATRSRKLKEWSSLLDGAFGYFDYMTYGPVVRESVLGHDEKGNVSAVRVPNTQARNEAKILSFNWKTLDTDVKVLRSGAKGLSENTEFCKAIAQLKRSNALSDEDKLQEGLEDIVSRWSNVLYLTQNELSAIVSEALTSVGATNFDDETCDFIAEALLVTAHSTYVDRVSKIMGLAGVKTEEIETEDAYEAFKGVANNFFPSLDENASNEMQLFVDLYESLREVYAIAEQANNDFVKQETAGHLNELAAIIQREVQPSLEIATAAAEWLNNLVETNLDGEGWDVSNGVHVTVNGDHPKMKQIASKGYTPSSDFSGDWGDVAPVSDGKGYKGGLAGDMRSNSWGNIGGNGVYPTLSNPYTPKPFGDYKIAGEKSVDNDSNQLAHWGSGDTWPGLQNPYNPKAETPQTYKMNHGKEADLIVDK